MWTADTGNASRIEWNVFQRKDKYLRMARVAIRVIRFDEGTRAAYTQLFSS
jgi:hypothetical protein